MVDTAVKHSPGAFPVTRWTLIQSSREGAAARQRALEELLGLYWKPLYFYIRRKGRDDQAAQDAVQDLMAQLLERDFTAHVDPERGRFRSYLRAAADNYLVNLHHKENAQKRGGGMRTVSLDFETAGREFGVSTEDPGRAFDREWATGVMDRALERLRAEFASGARKGPFELVLRFFQFGQAPTYEAAAQEAGMSLPQLKAFVHRARVRFRELVRLEVTHTLTDPADIDQEVTDLVKALSS